MKFNKAFFERHQKLILIWANLKYGLLVCKITPNALHYWKGKNKRQAIIYSNAQYSEALNLSFRYLWKLIHWWDAVTSFAPAFNLGFDTYTSPQDGTGVDTHMRENVPTTNFGTSLSIRAGDPGASGSANRALITLDFSSIPSGSETTDATLSLWIKNDSSSNARTLSAYRVLRAWVEAEATWNIYSTGNNWGTAGCGNTSTDRDAAASVSVAVGASPSVGDEIQMTSWTTANLDAMFGASPSYTNNGFLLKVDTENTDLLAYDSSDGATAGERPKIVINYTLAADDTGDMFDVM